MYGVARNWNCRIVALHVDLVAHAARDSRASCGHRSDTVDGHYSRPEVACALINAASPHGAVHHEWLVGDGGGGRRDDVRVSLTV